MDLKHWVAEKHKCTLQSAPALGQSLAGKQSSRLSVEKLQRSAPCAHVLRALKHYYYKVATRSLGP